VRNVITECLDALQIILRILIVESMLQEKIMYLSPSHLCYSNTVFGQFKFHFTVMNHYGHTHTHIYMYIYIYKRYMLHKFIYKYMLAPPVKSQVLKMLLFCFEKGISIWLYILHSYVTTDIGISYRNKIENPWRKLLFPARDCSLQGSEFRVFFDRRLCYSTGAVKVESEPTP
jgi:hypothetical protein